MVSARKPEACASPILCDEIIKRPGLRRMHSTETLKRLSQILPYLLHSVHTSKHTGRHEGRFEHYICSRKLTVK